jgi:ferredoxin
MVLQELAEAVAAQGLLLRGGFHPRPEDGVPPLADGKPSATLLMIGNAGAALWRRFSAAPEAGDGAAHPLDRWTLRVVGALAAQAGATALFPFGGPPWLPFQRWALRAEPVHVSPLGMLIHPVYGLWHAYRGALAFAERLALPPQEAAASPCDSCAGRPCLRACPVAAFSPAGYDVAACRSHLAGVAGGGCFAAACLARAACPVGRQYAYGPGQATFHMRAFAGTR